MPASLSAMIPLFAADRSANGPCSAHPAGPWRYPLGQPDGGDHARHEPAGARVGVEGLIAGH
jgi:hypothetical protein